MYINAYVYIYIYVCVCLRSIGTGGGSSMLHYNALSTFHYISTKSNRSN